MIMLFPVVAMQIIGTRYFQAIGKAGIATFLGLSRQVFIFIPVFLSVLKSVFILFLLSLNPVSRWNPLLYKLLSFSEFISLFDLDIFLVLTMMTLDILFL